MLVSKMFSIMHVPAHRDSPSVRNEVSVNACEPHRNAEHPVAADSPRPLEPLEVRLIEQVVQKKEVSEILPVAVKRARDNNGVPLPRPPWEIYEKIATHLDDKETKSSLSRVWLDRQQLSSQQSVLRWAAKAYGFHACPEGDGWLKAVKEDGVLLDLLTGELLPHEAVRKCPDSKAVVMRAVVEPSPYPTLSYASRELKDDREVVMAAIAHGSESNFTYASDRLKDDYEVVMAVVAKHGSWLGYASKRLRGNREVVMLAIADQGWVLAHASESLRADREVVMRAVHNGGVALKSASKALQDDREVVMCAVGVSGYALEYASESLQADREVVMRAVCSRGEALKYADKALRKDREVVLRAIEQDYRARCFIDSALDNDEEINAVLAKSPW